MKIIWPKFTKPNLAPLKTIFNDIVDTWMLVIFTIIAFVDLWWHIIPPGGYAFFLVYTTGAVLRMNYWKDLQRKTK